MNARLAKGEECACHAVWVCTSREPCTWMTKITSLFADQLEGKQRNGKERDWRVQSLILKLNKSDILRLELKTWFTWMWGDEQGSFVQCLNGLLETTQSLDQLQLHWHDQVLPFPDDKRKNRLKKEKTQELILLGGLMVEVCCCVAQGSIPATSKCRLIIL